MSLHDQPEAVQSAYRLLFNSATMHSSSTALNCAQFIVSWYNQNICGWGPGTIVSRDDDHKAAMFTIMDSFRQGMWYPDSRDIATLMTRFRVDERMLDFIPAPVDEDEEE